MVAALALALTAAVVVLIWLAAAGGAAASDRGSPAGGAYQGLTQVVVRPGQTLWSIAAAAEPSADPRVVIQQIIEANALSGATIQTGQLLSGPERLTTKGPAPAGGERAGRDPARPLPRAA